MEALLALDYNILKKLYRTDINHIEKDDISLKFTYYIKV